MADTLTSFDENPHGLVDFPMAKEQTCPFDPPPALKRIQDEQPLTRVRLWDGSSPWLVTRFEDVRTLLSDARVSSNALGDGFPHFNAAGKARFQSNHTFVNMDAPEHPRMRKMVTRPFMVKRVEALRPQIQAMTNELIDEMLAGPKPADFIEALALPLPSLVISELLGVPYQDHKFFQDQSAVLAERDAAPEKVVAAIDALRDYLGQLIQAKRKSPQQDLLSELVTERVDNDELTDQDAVELSILLLAAGHETTANMIGLGTLALLQHPDQLALVRETDDPAVVSKTVEELLRWLTIPHLGRRRVAAEDIEIGGVVIRAGEGIICAADIANRDPAEFENPDALDITRDARKHVAFGFGVHQCLGQPLARVELQVVWSTLFKRVPTLALSGDFRDLPYKHDALIYGLYDMPVTW
ncbi:cytochrome P450 [Nocardioides marmoriginsengisoli]|uniref:Cytochrome P450 n=1 Tax=Nocardioides marmoriginsengisoli TaxID=661483 RepID=A0A3N0CHI4_9ACTN|nr:cytochrome P450 [Nocardioides marmoriginsengisoli]RNL62905.1 cytochrome P450 [Nocardioides marmoriginsengisoli]